MLSFLPGPLIGVLALLLYTMNVLFWPWIIYLVAILRFIPIPAWQNACNRFLNRIPDYWADVNRFVTSLTSKVKLELIGFEQLSTDSWYYMICNHQSWTDIIILEEVFTRKIPTLRFFMKKEILWNVPFAGLAANLLNFPIMQRHSKEYLAKHPEQKGKDIETTRKACEKFKDMPTTVISFLEGTRFTPEKHQHQQSPFKHLLRPKAGGMAFAFMAMGEYFNKLLDVTIVYPDPEFTVWKFLCGKMKKIIIKVEVIPITQELLGDYENNREFRVYFQNWLNKRWEHKDEVITEIMNHVD